MVAHADILGAVADDIEAMAEGNRANAAAMRAGAQALARYLEQCKGYRERMDAAVASGTIPPAAADHAYMVFRDLVQTADDIRRGLEKQRDEVEPFSRGLLRAAEVARARADRATKQAARRARDAEEMDKRHQARAEDKKAPAAKQAPAAPKPKPRKSRTKTPAKPRKPKAAPKPKPGACPHCGDEIGAGGKWCVPCTSHRNRHGELPPGEALERRRAANAAHT